jgi:hypothetical protein
MKKIWMLASLIRQREMLENLISHFEQKQRLHREDYDLYDHVTLQIEKNLKQLRNEKNLQKEAL